MKRIFAILALSLAASAAARADQCAWLDAKDQKSVYSSAVKLLRSQGDFIDYCANCGDDIKKVKIQKVATTRFAAPTMYGEKFPNYRSVYVNKKEKDLAYIYVRTGSRVFTNVALMVGCPAVGVPPVMYTAPGQRAKPVSYDDLASGRTPLSAEVTPEPTEDEPGR